MNHRAFPLRLLAVALLAHVVPTPSLRAGERVGQVGERRQELGREIAALEAKMVALQPEFEREQHRWEADVLQQAGPARTGGAEVPPRIRTILELEPSEREPAQREEVAAFFRPLSKTLGDICRQLAAQRAALAALRPEK